MVLKGFCVSLQLFQTRKECPGNAILRDPRQKAEIVMYNISNHRYAVSIMPVLILTKAKCGQFDFASWFGRSKHVEIGSVL
jgi:hypothetical protein